VKELKSRDDLIPDARNANLGTERGRYMLDHSLRTLGAGRSIVVDAEGRVAAGNKTLEVAEEIGLPIRVIRTDGNELVVVQRTDWDLLDDSGAARQYAYADNRSSEIGLDWDTEQIELDIVDGIELDALFRADEIEDLGIGGMPDIEFKEYDESIADEVEYITCPRCGHKWPA